MSRGKIVQMTSVHIDTDTRILYKQCTSLAAAGYEVHLVTARGKSRVENGVQIHCVEVPQRGKFQRMLKTSKAVFDYAKTLNGDIYHFHDPELLPYGVKLRKMGFNVIYDAHEYLPKDIKSKSWIPGVIRLPVSYFMGKYEQSKAAQLSAVIAATPHIASRFNPKKTVTVNNFPLRDELVVPESSSTEKKHLVYVGGLTKIRGISNMIQAMVGTNGLNMQIGGSFAPESYEVEAKQLEGWQYCNYLGYVNRAKYAELLSEALAGMVTFLPEPNSIEARPNKLFEYMSAGTPVIASHFPDWKAFVEGEHCGLCVDPENISEIRNAIQYLQDNPDEAKEMGKNGRRAIEERYNWEIEFTKLDQLYQSLLN